MDVIGLLLRTHLAYKPLIIALYRMPPSGTRPLSVFSNYELMRSNSVGIQLTSCINAEQTRAAAEHAKERDPF